MYKDIVDMCGCSIPVVWGEGGGQTKRMKELNKKGIEYIHIPSSLLS